MMNNRLVSMKILVLPALVTLFIAACAPTPPCSDHLDSPNGSVAFGSRACSPDSDRYAREVDPANQGQIGIFDQVTNRLLVTVTAAEQDNELKGLAWSPDGQWLAYMYHHGPGGYIAIVDAETAQPARTIPIDAWYHFMRFAPNGAHLLVAAQNEPATELEVWPKATPTSTSVPTEPAATPVPTLAPTLTPVNLRFLGLNYAWYNYGHDFGTTAWSHDGVSAEASRAAIEADFANMQRLGVQAVRWFVLADGRASPEFDANGFVTGFDEFFYDDLDAALEIADKYNIDLVLVLFDFYWFESPKIENDVQLFGRADVIIDPDKRQSLLDNALRPLFRRYGRHPRIVAWDVINEPEGAMTVAGGDWVGGAISESLMREFIDEVVMLIHAEAAQPVTLGSASRGMLQYWLNSHLDFYQFHYYDHMESLFPIDVPAASLGLDRPVIVGEFPTRGSRYSVTEYLDMIQGNGYRGAFPWSYRAGGSDNASDFLSQAVAYCEWARTHVADQGSLTCTTPTPVPVLAAPTSTPAPSACSDHVNSPHGSVPFGSRACSPDGTRYAQEIEPANQGQIGIFDRATDALLVTIKVNEENNDLKGLAWSPDSQRLAFMYHHDSGSYIAVVDAQTGKPARSIPVNNYYHYMRFTADGAYLLVSAWNLPETKLELQP